MATNIPTGVVYDQQMIAARRTTSWAASLRTVPPLSKRLLASGGHVSIGAEYGMSNWTCHINICLVLGFMDLVAQRKQELPPAESDQTDRRAHAYGRVNSSLNVIES